MRLGKTNWTRPTDLRAQVQKLWDRGEILAGLVSGEPLFPRRLALKPPTSAEMSEHFDAVRTWIAELREASFCRVEMREFKHRLFGANAVPDEAWIDTFDAAVALIGKRREATRFAALLETTRSSQPRLLDWLAKRPLRALALYDEWHRLLEIVAWLERHPRPGVYLRHVDIPGVHSKFIEAHRGVLAELLDAVLPPDAIDADASGVSQFARRYGFRDKPARIRFRILDGEQRFLPGGTGQDITLDAASFALLEPQVTQVTRVFITENETNFLAFPEVPDSLLIFGAGYGFDMLAQAAWLSRRRIYYWGDIDTHGFAILDQLRRSFAHVASFLMDRPTLMAHQALWGSEPDQVVHDLPCLTVAERALFDELRDNRIRKNLRLEQEMIGFGLVRTALANLIE